MPTKEVRPLAEIGSIPDVTEVKGWQAVAELAQVRGLALGDAVLLHAAGADSLDEVSRWPLSRLRTTLPHLDDGALLELARDVVRLWHTGVVNAQRHPA